MKSKKITSCLLSLCCSWMLSAEAASTQQKESKLTNAMNRRGRSLASLVETDATIQPTHAPKTVPPVVNPPADTDVPAGAPAPAETKAPDKKITNTPIVEHDAVPAGALDEEGITTPAIAQVTQLNDDEDDDYDDLGDRDDQTSEDQDTLPVDEVNKEAVREGARISIKEKVIRPADNVEQDVIEFQFEDADLQNLIKQVSELYGLTFITDDAIYPLPQNGKAVKGNKISFHTQKPLSKKQAWHLFQTFLDVAGLTLVPLEGLSTYRIVKTDAARKSAIPTFIGVKSETLPDSDQLVRYLYFVQNISVATLKSIIDELRSPASLCITLQELNAFVLTDKSYNIKSLMNIINELDRVAMPQSMSVLKLRRANAQEVKALYDSLTKSDDKTAASRMLSSARKQPTALYFPENVRIIAEPRTNSLILLGAQDAIARIEEFIIKYVDIEIGKPHSPLRVYKLKYADASTVASIMTDLTQFGKDTIAGKVGGVRDGDKYMKPMTFTPELATNHLIIRGDEEDYIRVREIIQKLDEPQPQVAIEVLILSINIADNRNLGTQIRSKQPGINGLVGDQIKYQTSGSRMTNVNGSGIVTRSDPSTGAQRLLGNLINLAVGALPGNTLLTLGSDNYGVWGIFNILQTLTNTQIVSNPFIVATNKQKATVAVGQTRRVISATVATSSAPIDSRSDDSANLAVSITPQINSDGMIVLDVAIDIDAFVDNVDLSSATKATKSIKTSTIVADREVLALGGLIKNQVDNSTSKWPLLGNIPIIGWLFKNKIKSQNKDNLLVLISSRIIKPEEASKVSDFTQTRINDYVVDREIVNKSYEQIDPIQRLFFNEDKGSTEAVIDDFIFRHNDAVLKQTEKIEQEQIKPHKKTRSEKKQDARLAKLARKQERQTTKLAKAERKRKQGKAVQLEQSAPNVILAGRTEQKAGTGSMPQEASKRQQPQRDAISVSQRRRSNMTELFNDYAQKEMAA